MMKRGLILKIKVLHVLLSNKFSGAENVACQIIDFFRDDINFEMAYTSQDGAIKESLEQRNIDFYPMKKLCLKELNRVINTFNPDIVHAHDATASVLSALLKKKYSIVSHLHGNPPWLKSINKNSISYLICSKRFKKILVVSDAIMKDYIFGDRVEKKTFSVANPINSHYIRRLSKEDKQITSHYDVIYIGRLAKPKNPLKFIEIISILKYSHPNIKACMIGEGDLKANCEEQIKILKLEQNIKLYGFLDNPYGILKNSKVLCVTSDWEGYGLVVTESFSLEKPVVCSHVGGLINLVDETCGKTCNTTDEFVVELNELLTNEDYLAKKSVGAMHKIKLLEKENNYKQDILSIYNSVII